MKLEQYINRLLELTFCVKGFNVVFDTVISDQYFIRRLTCKNAVQEFSNIFEFRLPYISHENIIKGEAESVDDRWCSFRLYITEIKDGVYFELLNAGRTYDKKCYITGHRYQHYLKLKLKYA